MQSTTLFISPGACSFGSLCALEMVNKPYQVCITSPQIRASSEFRAINPLGNVGTLNDGNNIVYENLAILLYLVDNNSDSKIGIPLASKNRIETYKWLSYLSSTLHTAFSPLFVPGKYINKGTEAEMAAFRIRTIENIEVILKFIDAHLEKNAYFVGNALSVVDAQAYGLLRWTEPTAGIQMSKYKNIEKFMMEMAKVPAIKNALYIEQQQQDKVTNSSFAGYFKFS